MTKLTPLPSQEDLHRLFYCVGGTLIRKVENNRGPNRWVGDRPGGTANGYLKVRVLGETYSTHRVVWKYYYNTEPPLIDHDDRNRSNNNIWNLVESNHSHNRLNADDVNNNPQTYWVDGKQHYTEHGLEVARRRRQKDD